MAKDLSDAEYEARRAETTEILRTIPNPFFKEAFDLLNMDMNGCPYPRLCIEETAQGEAWDFLISCQCDPPDDFVAPPGYEFPRGKYDYECFEGKIFYVEDLNHPKYGLVSRLMDVYGEAFRAFFRRAYINGMSVEDAVDAATTEVALMRLNN